MYKYVQHKERNNQPYKNLKKLSSKIAIYRFEIDEEKSNNLDLTEEYIRFWNKIRCTKV